MTDAEVRADVAALEGRLEGLDAQATGAVEALLRLYGEALRRIVAACRAAPAVADALTADELVGHLLLLHELHPASLDERVAQALVDVQPYLARHGGGVDLVGIADGMVRVRLRGACVGCAASTTTLKLAVEEAVLHAAPELEGVEALEAVEEEAGCCVS